MQRIFCLIAVILTFAAPNGSYALNLFVDNFDANSTAAWSPINNGIGTNNADIFFDYSTASIPSAPHSTGGTTRGMKLAANVGVAPASGVPAISASPIGLTLTGDYTLQFDWWHNYIGPLNTNAQTGSTMYSTYGVMSTGTSANNTTVTDGIVFAATGDGGTAADFRIASPETPGGYAAPDPLGHATYAAGSQNSSAGLYGTLFPAGATAPGSQAGLATQTAATLAGNAGFRWHDVKITKSGTLVSWAVDGTLLGTLETAALSTPATGSNITFGSSDINTTTSTNALYPQVAFTLIDNVVVSSLQPADFNNNSSIDAADYTIWRDNFGNNGVTATKATGDANGDHIVDLTDYTIWKNALATPGSGGLSSNNVPEPCTLLLAVVSAAALACIRRR